MSVSVQEFMERMEERWLSFGNVVNDPLRLSWRQLCTTLNDKLRAAGDPNEEEAWKVLCPPTGSGKTQGLIVYASMLNQEPIAEHPGMLIVTRLIADSDKIANQIAELSREYSGGDTEQGAGAISYHSDKRGLLKMSDLAAVPVLVITHKAYSLALDMLSRSAGIEDTWDYFYSFVGGSRKLVVIDEAIDLVDYSETSLREIRNLQHFSKPIKEAFPFQYSLINCMETIFEEMKRKEQHPEAILKDCPVWEWPSVVSNGLQDFIRNEGFTEFKKALRGVRMDGAIMKKDPLEHMRILQGCLRRFQQLTPF